MALESAGSPGCNHNRRTYIRSCNRHEPMLLSHTVLTVVIIENVFPVIAGLLFKITYVIMKGPN